MKIAISGSSGLIGSALRAAFLNDGYSVLSIKRSDVHKGKEYLMSLLHGVNIVINLSGAPILQRWTSAHKKEILRSRVNTTHALVDAINEMVFAPELFISASAVGIYDPINVHDEFSTNFAGDFISEVCLAWEAEALKINSSKTRLLIFRIGIVISSKGGALKKMMLPFKMGLGGRIGQGDQPFPWIHIDDVVSVVNWTHNNKNAKGVYNLVAPDVLSNKDFSKILAFVLKRPLLFPVPQWGLKLLYGEGASVLISGQQVVPHRLLADGFTFSHPELYESLKHEIRSK